MCVMPRGSLAPALKPLWAAMGFEGVEFAGYYTYADRAADLAKRLQTLGLVTEGTHVRMDVLQGDALKRTIDFLQAIDEGRDPLVDGREGRKSVEIIRAIYRSAETGSQVTLPLED